MIFTCRYRELVLFVPLALLSAVFPATILGDQPASNRSFAASIFRAAMENNFAIENSEVRIVEDFLITPTSKGPVSKEVEIWRNCVSRIAVDRKNERLVRLKLEVEQVRGEEWSKHSPHRFFEKWIFEEYRDGLLSFTTFSSDDAERNFEATKLQKRKVKFDEFCARNQVPNHEFWNFWRSTTPFGIGRVESVYNGPFNTGDVTVRRLPDGSVKLTKESTERSQGQVVHVYFDAKTQMPFKQVTTVDQNDTQRIVHEHTATIEQVNGIFRTTHLSQRNEGEKRLTAVVATSPDALGAFDRIGTIDIEWLQFNEANLKLPIASDILRDEAQRARFLSIDVMTLGRERK
jgi:hypothetical protein